MSIRFIARTILILLILATAGLAAEANQTRELPPELGKAVTTAQNQLQQENPQQAIDTLRAYEGEEDDAIRHLLLGHAYARIDNFERAIQSYRQALSMDEDMTDAHAGLARIYFQRQEWAKAAEELGQSVDIDRAEADELALYAQTALELEDLRLARILIRNGITRFPRDSRFRRLDLALQSRDADPVQARRSLLFLLNEKPGDTELWGQLAAFSDDSKRKRVALEASLLANPSDLERHRDFLSAHLSAGHWMMVIKRGKELMSGSLANRARQDVELIDLLVRAADMGERDDLLAKWLNLVPEEEYTDAMRIAQARSSLRQGEQEKAREVLSRLIELGGADASVFLWAGHLAEEAEDYARAQALYNQASQQGGTSGNVASLYLARMFLRQGRIEQSSRAVKDYLKSHPADSTARSLLRLVRKRSDEAKGDASDNEDESQGESS